MREKEVTDVAEVETQFVFCNGFEVVPKNKRSFLVPELEYLDFVQRISGTSLI